MYINAPLPSFPILQTTNLRLRELVHSDADAVFRIFSDDEVTRFYDFDTFTNVNQAVELIARQRARYERGEGIRWGITEAVNDVVIGTVGYVFTQSNAQGGLGYDLARPYWRRGMMSEALGIVINCGFNAFKLNRVQALVLPGNVASLRLLWKLGFQEEGTLRDYAFFRGRYHDLRSFSLLRRDR